MKGRYLQSPILSVVVTFHREGLLAQPTLRSLLRCARQADTVGISSEFVLVLDAADKDTVRVVENFDISDRRCVRLHCDFGDAAGARMNGIASSSGKIVSVADGDDLYSLEWLSRSVETVRFYGERCIAKPELLVAFGDQTYWARQVDQIEDGFRPEALLMANFGSSWVTAARETFEECPYGATTRESGFGHEDWHWNCETVAAGYVHRLAIGTCAFYRRRLSGRLLSAERDALVVRPTTLFSLPMEQ
ncbi:MAG: glycosyltransferase family A protein [Devosia sp.]